MDLRICHIAKNWTKNPDIINYNNLGLKKDDLDIENGLQKKITYYEVWEDLTEKKVVEEVYAQSVSNGLIVAKTKTVNWFNLDETVGYTKVYVETFSDFSKINNCLKVRKSKKEKCNNLLEIAELVTFLSLSTANAEDLFEYLLKDSITIVLTTYKNPYQKYAIGLTQPLVDVITNCIKSYIDNNVSDLIIPNNSTAETPVTLRNHLVAILSS